MKFNFFKNKQVPICVELRLLKKNILRLELVPQNFNENMLCSVFVSYISNSTEIIRMSF